MSDVPANDPAYTPIPGIAPEVDLGPEQPSSGPTTVIHGDRNVTYTQPEVVTPHLQAADYPSNSGIYNKEDAARAAGYSWQDIDAHIGPAQVAAQDAGYTQDEINQYLGYASPDAMVSRNTTAWAQVQHYDPKTLQPTSDGALDLTANPNWKGDYAAALLRGEVKGPKDFADNYAASAITASGGKNPQLLAAGAAGADQMAAQLPGRRDLTDAALSLGGAFDVAKQNLMDHWEETGQSPLDAAIKAQTNPALNAKLTTQPTTLSIFEQSLKNIANAARQGVEDVYSSDLAGGAEDWGVGGRDPNTFKLLAYIAAKDVDALSRTVFQAPAMALARGGAQYLREMGMSEGGADDAMRDALALASFPGFGTHGVEIPAAIKALRQLPVDVIDLAKAPGEAVTQAPLSEILKPIEPAERGPIIAYHGTPHTFEPEEEAPFGNFRIENVGTGEGAQAYGYGVYTAESSQVAASYREKLSQSKLIDKAREAYDEFDNPADAEAQLLENPDLTPADHELLASLKEDDWLGFDFPHQAVSAAFKEPEQFDISPRTQAALDNMGSMYKVQINAHPNNFLDLDKTLGEQSPEVAAAVKDYLNTNGTNSIPFPADVNARDWLDGIESYEGNAKNVSDALAQRGVKGTRYFDQLSRYSDLVEPEGAPSTRNYVVFNPKDMQILERNGKLPNKEFAETATPASKIEALAQEHIAIREYAPLTDEQIANFKDLEAPGGPVHFMTSMRDELQSRVNALHKEMDREDIEPDEWGHLDQQREVMQQHLDDLSTTVDQLDPDQIAGIAESFGYVGKAEPNTKANMQGVLNAKADQLETMRLTREGHLPDEFDRPNFFQNLAKDEDPATQELAKGYDAASGLARFFQQTLPNLFTEEKGAVPVGLGQVPKTLNPDEVAPGSLLAYRTGQNATETLVRQYATGRARAQIAYTASQLDGMRATLAPHLGEWMDSLENWRNGRPGVAPWDTVYGKLIGYMENVPGYALAKDDPFTPVANQLRELLDWSHRWMQDAADRGLMPEVNYVEGYFPHRWEDPNKALRIFGNGVQGSRTSTMHRTVPNTFDGLKEGLIPIDKDPLNMILRTISGNFRNIASLDILQQAKDLNWVREPGHAEPTDVPLTGIGARRIIPLTDAVTGEPAGHTVGNLMAHPGFTNVYNKWAEMIDTPLSKTEQFLGRLKNTALGYYLVVPIFHAWNILQIVGGGGFGRMWRDILHNEYGNAAIDLGKASTVAWPAVETYKAGQAFKKGYLKFGGMEPGQISDDPLISAIVAAGGGASKESTEILRPGMGPNWITAARQGMLKNQLREQWMRVTGPWKHDVFTKDAAGNPVINVGAMPNAVMAMPSTALDLIGEATGAISAPLFEHAIPILKDGANMRAAEEVLRRGAQNGTDPNLVALQIRQVVKNTDDRMGEMLHENLFWSRGLKRFANLTMLSVNWIYGEVRQTAAALGIQLQGKGTHWAWNEHAATNLVGTLTLAALIGGMYTWLKTGTAPKDPMDFIVPRTGATQKGVPVRVLLPGGQKEFLDWGRIAANTIAAGQDDGAQAAIMAATTGSADYLFGKRNNTFGSIAALASGKEYPGGPEIAHEPGQLEGYLTRELLTPISAQTTMNPIPGTSALERFLTGERRASVLEENFPRWRSTTKYFNQKADASEISRARSQLNRQVGE